MDNHGSRNRRDDITSRLRLRDYDYSSPGYYFVTICTQRRSPLFGDVRDNLMALNEPGRMVDAHWRNLPTDFRGVTIDGCVTMPNHVHALVGIGVRVTDPEPCTSLVDVIHWFKSKTTTEMIKGVRYSGWPRFNGRLWQDRYYDHIVRNERELDILRHYIATNPERWDEDELRKEM